jgi:hypothetical protein
MTDLHFLFAAVEATVDVYLRWQLTSIENGPKGILRADFSWERYRPLPDCDEPFQKL